MRRSTFFLKFLLLIILADNVAATLTIKQVIPFASEFAPMFFSRDKDSKRVQIVGTRGEIESASIWLESDVDYQGLDVEVSALNGPSGVFDGANIDVRVVKSWYQAKGAWFSHGKSIKNPFERKVLVRELLLKDENIIVVDEDRKTNFAVIDQAGEKKLVDLSVDSIASRRHITPKVSEFNFRDAETMGPFSLQKGKGKQLWINVHIPQDAKTGLYKGTLTVKDANSYQLITVVNLVLEVLPFDLEDADKKYGLFYRSTLGQEGTISSQRKSAQQMRNELKNIRAHNVNFLTVYFNPATFGKTIDLYAEAGFKGNLLVIDFSLDKNVRADHLWRYEQRVQKIADMARSKGFTNITVFGVDEGDESTIKQQRPFWEAARRRGVNVCVTGYFSGLEAAGDSLDCFIEAHKLRSDARATATKNGVSLLSYGNPQVGVENPFAYRLNYGLALWAYRYDGALLYAYQDAFGFIYNDLDHKIYRDHCFTYPTAEGVIDTIAWEGFREAIDDVRYLETLESLVVRAEALNIAQPIVASAKRFIDDLRKRLMVYSSSKYSPLIRIDLDQIRAQGIELSRDLHAAIQQAGSD